MRGVCVGNMISGNWELETGVTEPYPTGLRCIGRLLRDCRRFGTVHLRARAPQLMHHVRNPSTVMHDEGGASSRDGTDETSHKNRYFRGRSSPQYKNTPQTKIVPKLKNQINCIATWLDDRHRSVQVALGTQVLPSETTASQVRRNERIAPAPAAA
ncbi:hypothetical protein BD410DRAFT_582848 [Rickenella mellea]|uniref:Uncharacterized protein n=1 Tax=Rickenella mellea TaxID=50990 RepID=A0A4Y7PQN0_9AGAM|nr:hypothetical protein BD410DRAFT_278306 [Rickenella mellea]TDL17172.1 hypothetical protein BD410DRAFT_582848 [Rickenella mellea]